MGRQISHPTRKQDLRPIDRLRISLAKKANLIEKLQFLTAPTRVEVGQLWALDAPRENAISGKTGTETAPRLVIVLESDGKDHNPSWVCLAGVSVETEYAGTYDLIVPMKHSPLGCSFMVEGWNVLKASRGCLGYPIAELHGSVVRDACALVKAHKTGTLPSDRVRGVTGAAFRPHRSEGQEHFHVRELEAMRSQISSCL